MIDDETLYRDTFGTLKLRTGGTDEEIAVRPTRAFPLSEPDGFVALLDWEGKEVALIEDLGSLPPRTRDLLRRELETSFFLPQVRQVREITDEFGVQSWDVETDRGPRRFEVRGREEARWVRPGHLILRDVDGNRYEIRQYDELDLPSRLKIESYL